MIQIRPCAIEDFEGVLTLLRQLWPDKYIDIQMLRAVYERALESALQHHVCAVEDQVLLGMGSLSIKNNLWQEGYLGYVEELVVHEKYRRRGIGTQLLEHLCGVAREKGCKRIELDSAYNRKASHQFYEKMGFESRAILFTKSL
jgi:GNAT superfamily N-acetyltransferase